MLRKFFYLYTSGLNRKEIERLLKKDTVDALSYFKRKTNLPDDTANRSSFFSFMYMCREIFISFIMQLTPARRLFYGIAVIGFLLGFLYFNLLYISIAFLILNVLLALELVDKLTTSDELEIAHEIQMSLQPFNIPESPLLSIATFSKPAKLVGGDFFDVVQPKGDKIISIVGDVSDKGISAALYAAYTQSMFQSFSETGVSASNIMHSLNDLISKRLRDGDFITAVIAYFDINEKSVTIARAGHNWPLYYNAESKTITALKPKGISIGLLGDRQFADQLEEQKIYLNQGDVLLLYSDGITEATDPKNNMFEIAGLKSTITECTNESCEMIINRINVQLKSFVTSDELQDDATMVAIKVK